MQKGSDENNKLKKTRTRKFFSRKDKKIIAVIIIIIGVLILILWGLTPSGYLTVNDVTKNPSRYLNKVIEVKGTVGDWNSSANTFNLTDEKDNLTVSYINLPEGFNNGRDVVVKGVLRNNGGLVIEAKEVIVGCPSKY